MEDMATTTTQQVCDEMTVKLSQTPDSPPSPRQFSNFLYDYDSQLPQVQRGAIEHWIGPRYERYNSLKARLNSFKDKWPEGKLPTPEALSEAGYFHDGWNDGTTCYHCGNTLYDWIASDDPFVEHARYSPYCVHLTYVRGHNFIRECKEKLEFSPDGDVELL